jgi:hypothetical protein
MMDDLVIKKKIQEFKSGYSVSCENDGRRKREVYTIQSPELKTVLRKMALSGESNVFFNRKAEIGSNSGNYSSYEENADGAFDRFVMIRFCNNNHEKKFKTKQSEKDFLSEKEEISLVPLNKKNDNQVAEWRSEETEAERWRREAEQ